MNANARQERGFAFLLATLTFLVFLSAAAREAQQGTDVWYRFAVGNESQPVASGIIWLYHYSWYGLHRYELARIEDGVAHIRLTEEQLKTEIKPHPNTEAYVLALDLPAGLWYRTEDIAPEALWHDLVRSLNALGEARPDPSGKTLLILPPPVPHRLILQDEEGSPAANLEVPVSIYLYDRNHRGHHSGLPLGTFLTNEKGAIEFQAPAVPLHLDVRFYDRQGEGPAGPAYSAVVGLMVGADSEIILCKAWDLPAEEFELHVLGGDGIPLPGVSINQAIRTGECGAWWGQVARTDDNGTAHFAIAPAATERLWLRRADGEERPLTASELETLFRDHYLVLSW